MKKMISTIFFFFIVITSTLEAKPYVVFQNIHYGLFSIFQMTLSLCECFENEVIQGGHLDFKNTGLYYEPKKGPNWWQYYFEPIHLGSAEGADVLVRARLLCYHIEFFNSREQNKALIEKYIKVKPHITQKIDNFAKTYFQGKYVIGVHYRGTDKKGEAPLVPYEQVAGQLEELISKLNNVNWTIFVATDDELFLRYMRKKFPNRLCYLPDAARSANGLPVHYVKGHVNGHYTYVRNVNPYKNGEDAVLDCWLLSKTNILFRTSSNLSFISSCINPQLPVVCLSDRHKRANGLAPGLTQQMLEKCKNKKDPTLYFD